MVPVSVASKRLQVSEDQAEEADEYVAALEGLIDVAAGADPSSDLQVALRFSALGAGDARARAEVLRDLVIRSADCGVGLVVVDEAAREADARGRVMSQLRPLNRRLALTVPARLHRSEADCAGLAPIPALVRLLKGSEAQVSGEGFTSRAETDRALVRAARIILEGRAGLILESADERIIEIARAIAIRAAKPRGDYSFCLSASDQAGLGAALVEDGERVLIRVLCGVESTPMLAQRQR